MRYLIVSDIHGSLPALDKVLAFYDEKQCDMLCILGDILNYGPRNGLPEGLDPKGIAERLNARADRIVAVRGNCDSEVDQMLLDFPVLADYALLVDRGRRFFLTHGHVYSESNMPRTEQWCATPVPSPSRKEATRLPSPCSTTRCFPSIIWTEPCSRVFRYNINKE